MDEGEHAPTGVIHMLIDTCVWLDLAKQADGGKMVGMLQELCDQGRIRLIVPQIVVDEFGRNRDRVQKAMRRSVSAKFREVRKAIHEHGRGDGKRMALDELDNITHQVPLVNEMAAQTFDAILKLLHTGKTIKPTAKMKEQVVERALTKRAPFQREKNSVADALIIEMYGAGVKATTESDRYCFITHNTKDFSTVNGDIRHPHAEYGFTRDNFENSESVPLFDEFLDLISELSPDDECGVLTWMMRR